MPVPREMGLCLMRRKLYLVARKQKKRMTGNSPSGGFVLWLQADLINIAVDIQLNLIKPLEKEPELLACFYLSPDCHLVLS